MKHHETGTAMLRFCGFILALAVAAGVPNFAQETCGVSTLGSCPAWGCSIEASDHGFMNSIKRRTGPLSGAEVHKLSFNDFQDLQDAVDAKHYPHGRGTDLSHTQRDVLKDIGPGGVGEGTYVQLTGYITNDDKNPRANTGESVNCGLTTQKNNDFHINLVGDSDGIEFEGVVAEMVPQDRADSWTLKLLRQVRKAERKVLVRGLLFYDNVHEVRTDPDENANGNPPRFSVWEIHPVSDFRVCMRTSNNCSPSSLQQWRKLETVTPALLKPFLPK